MASGATKMAVVGNMLMDVRVIDINERNLEVRYDTRAHLHCSSSIWPLPSCCYDKKELENFSFATELSPEDFGWEYQNYYTLPSLIRRQLAKRTYELPSEMAGFGSGSAGYLAGRSDSKAWLPDGDSQILRSNVFGPSGFWTMAPLRYAAK